MLWGVGENMNMMNKTFKEVQVGFAVMVMWSEEQAA